MHKLEVSISQELADTFNLALRISGDDQDEVFERLINQYAVEVLRQAASRLVAPKSHQSLEENTSHRCHSKAFNRFVGWARKSHQTNHQIIRAFFACETGGTASREAMCAEFMSNNPGRAPYYFENNLNSMTTDAGNSHGKCFDIIGDSVRFTAEIAPLASEYREYFGG